VTNPVRSETYRCGRCRQTKAADEFMPSQRKTGAWCRHCFREWHRGRAGPAPEPRPCEMCGTWIATPSKHRQRWCSPSCKQRASYWRQRPRSTKACVACGADLTGRRRDAKWCDERCAAEGRKQDGRQKTTRRRHLLKCLGLTPKDFDAMVSAQRGRCAICKQSVTRWHIDHDHACCPGGSDRRCGQCNRGLLCGLCNAGLGQFRDDPRLLRAAARYVASYAD